MDDRTPRDSQLFQDIMAFHEVARALTSSLDLNSILCVILQRAKQLFEPASSSLLLLDESQQNLRYAITDGEPASEQNAQRRIAIGEGIAGWAVQHGEPLIVPRINQASSPPEVNYPAVVSQFHSAICIPLRWQQRIVGAIELLNYRTDNLSEHSIAFLRVLCDYAAIAIQNARAIERIQELTITDDCTGLYNSRQLFTIMDAELERSRRFGLSCCLIFIDLDYFKHINDRYGHLVGSRLLAEAAQTFKSNIRQIDYAFRYGGDEFIIFLPHTEKDAALEVTQRLLHAVRNAVYLRSEDLNISIRASFGLASYPEDGSSTHEILGVADEMMYLVKNSTRDNIAVARLGCLPLDSR